MDYSVAVDVVIARFYSLSLYSYCFSQIVDVVAVDVSTKEFMYKYMRKCKNIYEVYRNIKNTMSYDGIVFFITVILHLWNILEIGWLEKMGMI